MKNVFKYLTIAAASMICLVSCFQEKSEIPVYEPAALESGAQVFFKDAPTTTIKLTKGEPSLDIAIARASTDALEVGLTVEGEDALKYFNVPESVSFAQGEKAATLTISAKDVNAMPMNEFFPLTIYITNAALTTAYGTSSFSFNIGIELPWVTFDEGTIYETPYWGEQEDKPIKYQQISDDIRYCVVEGCFGHDTGPSYPVQPYAWYWNTKTNAVYIPVQWMGYENSNGKTWFSDETAFYNLYWAMKNGDGYGAGTYGAGAGQVEGSDAWFEFCDAFRAAYPEDYYPYYDGKGKFYLADQYIAGFPGDASTYLGRYGVSGCDMYICSFAADYTISLSYEGLLLDKDGVEQVLGELTYDGADVTDVYALIVPGKDPEAAVDVLEGDGETPVNLEEVENMAVVSAAGTFRVPMIVDATDGFYSLVAVPVNAEGGFEWDYAVFETFAYGTIDPLYLEYTDEDFIDYVDKDDLLNTQWLAYAADYGGSASDRAACAYVTFEDAEDNDAGDDLITMSGLANVGGAFGDTITMEYYKGLIYTLAAQKTGTYSSYDVVYGVYSDNTDTAGNYAMYAAYVADGIIAFVNNSTSDNYYGIAFWAVSGGSIAGYLRAREYLLLVDPAILEEPAGSPKFTLNAVTRAIKNLDRVPGERHDLKPYDWSKKVVASGKVMSFNKENIDNEVCFE